MALAAATGRTLLSLEDGPLRGIAAGSGRGPGASITLDTEGIAIDASRPSRLERLIAVLAAPGAVDPGLARRAARGLDRLRALGLSKYSLSPRGAVALPSRGYVLVVDQVAGDASIRLGQADAGTFRAMLAAARRENPGCRIALRAHPDPRRGHLGPGDLGPGDCLVDPRANPWDAVEGAAAVYTVSSQLGLEAALAGCETHVFGLPFYAGWGLTQDRLACPRRRARPDPLALFAAVYLLNPLYWDPHDRRLTDFETALEILAERARVEQRDPTARHAVLGGIAPWKRDALRRFMPAYAAPPPERRRPARALALARRRFGAGSGRARAAGAGGARSGDPGAPGTGEARLWLWASRARPALLAEAEAAGLATGLIEDGFLRSAGLGARLTEPLSLVLDPVGIHYDPAHPSALERLVAQAAGLAPDDPRLVRARALRRRIVAGGVTKYSLSPGARPPRRPEGRRMVVVVGQVADDASVRHGTAGAAVRDMAGLLAAARAAEPDAFLVYRPHPDVEAGLRSGALPAATVRALADATAPGVPADRLLDQADGLWTLTSGMGFEALMRGIPVTCLGAPFYAGWGLTRDLGPVPARRRARPSLDALVWAALIAYPRYVHPVSGLATGPERIVAHLAACRAAGHTERPRSRWSRIMSAAQDGAATLGLVAWR
ncbi:MAG: capsular polysaccharide biosynthesis protein [Pseudomonadota bacterium]